MHFLPSLISILILWSCTTTEKPSVTQLPLIQPTNSVAVQVICDTAGHTLASRFRPPSGFTRIPVAAGSFAEYLRALPLKPNGADILRYDGEPMPYATRQAAAAVINMDIGKKDLQQCADAVFRLRAEYFYQRGAMDSISFHLTNGFKMDFPSWATGNRLIVQGNKTYWKKTAPPSSSYNDLRKFLDVVFTYAGTISMVKETVSVPLDEMKIGDVFVISDAHAVMVADMCQHPETGEKRFMLLQSYMPARDIHILKNGRDTSLSPWYRLDFGSTLHTPQWTFEASDLRRYP